jgi:multidrug efflux pump subunit AcrB
MAMPGNWNSFTRPFPEVSSYLVFVAPGLEKPNPVNSALSFVRLKPWDERQRKQQDIAKELAPKMFGGLPGVLAFPINPPSLGQSFRNPAVQFVIQANSYWNCRRWWIRCWPRLGHIPAWRTWIPTCA